MILNIKPGLNEEDFLEIYTKHPKSYKAFTKWISAYKHAVGWNDLFGDGMEDGTGASFEAPKFHEMPLAMQKGIFMEFMVFSKRISTQDLIRLRVDLKDCINRYFKEGEK